MLEELAGVGETEAFLRTVARRLAVRLAGCDDQDRLAVLLD
jgi:hypothetical protein